MRRGRMSGAQTDAIDRLDAWGLAVSGPVLDLVAVFGREAATVLEIGCGMGAATLQQAANDPATDVIAVDVHSPGIANVMLGVEQHGLTNVRVVLGDAVEFAAQRLSARSLAGVRIYFPDPWPKQRHHKRRLIQARFVSQVATLLVPGGYLHCATDMQHYADQMLAVLTSEPLLSNPFNGFAAGPLDRPLTKFEARAVLHGRSVRDVWVTRRLDS